MITVIDRRLTTSAITIDCRVDLVDTPGDSIVIHWKRIVVDNSLGNLKVMTLMTLAVRKRGERIASWKMSRWTYAE